LESNAAVTEPLLGRGALMPKQCGDHAVVIGAGIGGLAAAGAIAPYFNHVTVLERDELGYEPATRSGVPQSRHLHGLLVGGLLGLGEIFPGFDRYLEEAGAVPSRIAGELRLELPGFDPFPQRDFGWTGFTMSRPLIEHVVRQRLRKMTNVMLLDRCRVVELVAADDGSVTEVRCGVVDSPVRSLRADLIVDASGQGSLTLDLLKAIGLPKPEQTDIGIDMGYASATFEVSKVPSDWKVAVTYPEKPSIGKTGYLFQIEGGRWMGLVGERHSPPPSDSFDGFLELMRQLRTSTIYDTLKNAKPVGKVHRYAFPESSWRHYEQLATFPRGLIPLGDAMCRFNPIHGQGMAVAIQEACVLKDLLERHAGGNDPLDGLGPDYFAAIKPLLAGPWAMSAVPDFANPMTRGTPPKDLENSLRFEAGLIHLAARDAEVHELMLAVRYLVKPASALHDPDLVRRVQMELADA
jgi:2-polyprenyl-6-methoxyphenol hydroxylase-like FAD-dependent oxidoreductase